LSWLNPCYVFCQQGKLPTAFLFLPLVDILKNIKLRSVKQRLLLVFLALNDTSILRKGVKLKFEIFIGVKLVNLLGSTLHHVLDEDRH